MGLISVVWRLKTPPLPMIDSPMFVNENSQDMLSTSSIFTTASKLEKARHDFNQIKKWEHLQVIHAAQAMISAYDKEASVDKVDNNVGQEQEQVYIITKISPIPAGIRCYINASWVDNTKHELVFSFMIQFWY